MKKGSLVNDNRYNILIFFTRDSKILIAGEKIFVALRCRPHTFSCRAVNFRLILVDHAVK